MRPLCVVACAGLASSAALGQIDGANFDVEYGPALFAQTVGTQFGNNTDPSRDFANGSELDGVFARLDGTTLLLGVSGNLETNFNKLDLFIDFRDGGQNRLRGDNADVDFNGLNRMGDDGSGNGLTFDDGVAPDLYITYTNGNDPAEHFMNAAELLTDGGGEGNFVGGGQKSLGAIVGTGPGGMALSADGDNSNVLGVANLGDPFDSDPASVTTGFEFSIDLGALGYSGGQVIIAGFVNGGGHDFLSNQVIGGLPDGFGNLGEPRNVDFSTIDGDQFVVIPAPSAGLALVMGLGGLGLRRRR